MQRVIYYNKQLKLKHNKQFEVHDKMYNDIEHSILQFLRAEMLEGRFENTQREIANRGNLSYNATGRALERLIMKGDVQYRERGTERKPVRYYYLRDLVELCQQKWKTQDA